MIRWMGAMTTTGIEEIMVYQITILQQQMNTITASSEGAEETTKK